MAETNIRERQRLDHECAVFCRYLVQQAPTDYVRAKYRAGLAELLPDSRPSRLDSALVTIANAHPLLTRLADAYARFILPRSLLRVKLVLLLAILESVAPTEEKFRRTSAVSPLFVLSGLIAHTIGFVLTFLLSVLIFAPVHVVLSFGSRERSPTAQSIVAVERT